MDAMKPSVHATWSSAAPAWSPKDHVQATEQPAYQPTRLVGDIAPEHDAAFLQWCFDRGVQAKKLLFPSYTSNGIRGFLAKEDIDPYDDLVTVPSNIILSKSVCYNDPELGHVFRENIRIFDDDEDAALATFIAYHVTMKRESSFWWPYLRILPDIDVLADWDDAEMPALQDPLLTDMAFERRTEYQLISVTFCAILHQRYPSLFPKDKFTPEWFVWAYKQVAARGFGSRLPEVLMVPLADCFNHGNVATKYVFEEVPHAMQLAMAAGGQNRYFAGNSSFVSNFIVSHHSVGMVPVDKAPASSPSSSSSSSSSSKPPVSAPPSLPTEPALGAASDGGDAADAGGDSGGGSSVKFAAVRVTSNQYSGARWEIAPASSSSVSPSSADGREKEEENGASGGASAGQNQQCDVSDSVNESSSSSTSDQLQQAGNADPRPPSPPQTSDAAARVDASTAAQEQGTNLKEPREAAADDGEGEATTAAAAVAGSKDSDSTTSSNSSVAAGTALGASSSGLSGQPLMGPVPLSLASRAGPLGVFRMYPTRTTKYKAGEPVLFSYGRRDNSHLSMEYGFTLLDNEHETVTLYPGSHLDTLASPPLVIPHRARLIFTTAGITTGPFKLKWRTLDPIMLTFFRVLAVAADDAAFADWENGRLKVFNRLLTGHMESASLHILIAYLHSVLLGMGTSAADDEALLGLCNPTGPVPTQAALAAAGVVVPTAGAAATASGDRATPTPGDAPSSSSATDAAAATAATIAAGMPQASVLPAALLLGDQGIPPVPASLGPYQAGLHFPPGTSITEGPPVRFAAAATPAAALIPAPAPPVVGDAPGNTTATATSATASSPIPYRLQVALRYRLTRKHLLQSHITLAEDRIAKLQTKKPSKGAAGMGKQHGGSTGGGDTSSVHSGEQQQHQQQQQYHYQQQQHNQYAPAYPGQHPHHNYQQQYGLQYPQQHYQHQLGYGGQASQQQHQQHQGSYGQQQQQQPQPQLPLYPSAPQVPAYQRGTQQNQHYQQLLQQVQQPPQPQGYQPQQQQYPVEGGYGDGAAQMAPITPQQPPLPIGAGVGRGGPQQLQQSHPMQQQQQHMAHQSGSPGQQIAGAYPPPLQQQQPPPGPRGQLQQQLQQQAGRGRGAQQPPMPLMPQPMAADGGYAAGGPPPLPLQSAAGPQPPPPGGAHLGYQAPQQQQLQYQQRQQGLPPAPPQQQQQYGMGGGGGYTGY